MQAQGEVNIYSYREPGLIDPLLKAFTAKTNIKTNVVFAAAGFAAACGSSGSGKASTTKAEPKTLNFYNWTDYIADDTIPNFQKETGIKVTYDNYSSNDELFAKLSAGSTGYDIIVPTDATLVKMKHANLVEPLELKNIPNVKNLDERFRTAAFP